MTTTFEDLKINKTLLRAIYNIGFELPTPIQAKAIPIIKSGADVIGVAQTGTGKTAAFVIPLLMKLTKAEAKGPRAVILTPTRELTIQVGEDVQELIEFTNLRHATVYGGVGWTKHAELLKDGIDILVSTPGRLWELYQQRALELKYIRTLVIDEADRMLDMGFMPQLLQMLEVLPTKRQNLLFSATFGEKVEKMTEDFLDFPERVEVAPSATPAELVSQVYYTVPNFRSKLILIAKLLEDEEQYNRVIIFCRTKESAEAVHKVIRRKSDGDKRIVHSNKGQTSRLNAITDFKSGEVRILITTDVSARGIDVSKVSHVINFDLPSRHEDYIHRIGRTARANNSGEAISLINPAEKYHLNEIEKLMGIKVRLETLPKDIVFPPTEKDERQEQMREIDRQKRVIDPSYKGAFHKKKKKTKKDKDKKQKKLEMTNSYNPKEKKNRKRK
ncbi:MAG: DEAD/DEAH box helicase [Bacteroidales bacterium]